MKSRREQSLLCWMTLRRRSRKLLERLDLMSFKPLKSSPSEVMLALVISAE